MRIVYVSAPVPPLDIAKVTVTAAFPAAMEKLLHWPPLPPGLKPFATEADKVEADDVP
jgi:hypothetical protein